MNILSTVTEQQAMLQVLLNGYSGYRSGVEWANKFGIRLMDADGFKACGISMMKLITLTEFLEAIKSSTIISMSQEAYESVNRPRMSVFEERVASHTLGCTLDQIIGGGL